MINSYINNKFIKKIKIYISSKLYNSIYFRSFFPKLLISYYIIILVCICSMGILSYSFVSSSIKDQYIKSNDKLLNQFKNTVDSLILGNINDLSLKILQDTYANFNVSYYFSNSMENKIYDILKVQDYCNTLKTVNPMLYFVGIYYEKNQLLISNEGVRSTMYDKMSSQKDLLYYYNLINASTTNLSWHVNHNFKVEYDNYVGTSTNNIIHMIRKVPFISESTNVGGAIIISIDEDVFYKLIKKTAAQDLDKIIISDSKGSVISHTDKELLGQNITDFSYGSRIIHSPESSGNFIVNIGGIPSIVSFCTSEYSDWKYITITPIEKYTSAAGYLVKIIALVALASIIIGLIISLIPALKLSNPMRKLVDFCIGVNKNPGLKPENEYNIIQSTIENLSFNIKEQEHKFMDVLPVLKENFLQSLITNQYTNTNEIEIRMQMLDLSFPHNYFCALTFSNAIDDILLNEYVKINIVAALRIIFDSDTSKCFHCEKDGNSAVIINFDMEVERIHELLYSFESSKDNELTKGLFFSMGTKVEDITQISKSYTTANIGLKYRYLFPDKKLIRADEIISHEASNVLPDKNLINSFIASLRKQDRNNTINDLCNIITAFRTEDISLEHIMESLSACVAAIDEVSAADNIQISDVYSEDGSISRYFKKIDNIIDFQEWMTEIIIYVFDYMSHLHSESNKEMVQKAIDQIKKDISSPNLSLKTIAKALYISQSHLSRIFKSETGITFIDYVSSLKLDYCKDLLLSTTMKIDEIALMMGYSTSHYFISRFKIKYGCTPKKYRCKYSGNIEI